MGILDIFPGSGLSGYRDGSLLGYIDDWRYGRLPPEPLPPPVMPAGPPPMAPQMAPQLPPARDVGPPPGSIFAPQQSPFPPANNAGMSQFNEPPAPPQDAALPPNATPAVGQMAQRQAAMPQPDFGGALSNAGDRLSAGLMGFAHSGAVIPGLANMIAGFATGERQDAAGIADRNRKAMVNAVFQSLRKKMPDDQALAVAQASYANPQLATTILPKALGLDPPKTMEELIARQAASGAGGQDAMTTYADFIKNKESAQKAGQVEGERQATARLDLSSAVAKAKEQMSLLQKLKSHPGRNTSFWHSMVSPYVSDEMIPGNTQARDAAKILQQVKGGAFLAAFESLKGGGQITQVEGDKATQAITRMERALSRKEFDQALDEYMGILRLGIDRANQLAGRPAPYGFQGSQSPASNIPPPPNGFTVVQ